MKKSIENYAFCMVLFSWILHILYIVLKYYEIYFVIIKRQNRNLNKNRWQERWFAREMHMKKLKLGKKIKIFHKIKIGRRLFAGFAMLNLLIIAVGIGSIQNVGSLADEISVLNGMMDTESNVTLARVEQTHYEVEGTDEIVLKSREYISASYEAIDLLEKSLTNGAYKDKPEQIREQLANYETNLQNYIDLEKQKVEQDEVREKASQIVIEAIQETMGLQKTYALTRTEAGEVRETFDKYVILGAALDTYQEACVMAESYVETESEELSKELIKK